MIGETDGVGWARRATKLMLEHDLPTFPRARGLDHASHVGWRMSSDVAAELRSLVVPPGSAMSVLQLPMVAEELFGYQVNIDEGAPPATIEVVPVTVAVNDVGEGAPPEHKPSVDQA